MAAVFWPVPALPFVVRRRCGSPFRVPLNTSFVARSTGPLSSALVHPAAPKLQAQEVLASHSDLQRRPCGRRASPRPGRHSSLGLPSDHTDVSPFAVRSDAVGIDDQGPSAQVLDVVVLGDEIKAQEAPLGIRRGQVASGSSALSLAFPWWSVPCSPLAAPSWALRFPVVLCGRLRLSPSRGVRPPDL